MIVIKVGKSPLQDTKLISSFNADSVMEVSFEELSSLDWSKSYSFVVFENSPQRILDIYKSIRSYSWNSFIAFFVSRPQEIASFFEYDNYSFSYPEQSNLEVVKVDFEGCVECDSESEDYIAVPLKSLYLLEKTPADLYVKLSDKKMVKILNRETEGVPSYAKRYEDKNCEYFFVRASEYPYLVEQLANDVSKQKFDIPEGKNIAIQSETFEFVHNSLHLVGLNEQTFKLTNHLIQDASSFIKNNKDLTKAWGKVCGGKNYLVEHSLLLSHILVGASCYFDCDALEMQKKLLLSAIFHDISLTSSKMAQVEGTKFEQEFYQKKYREEFDSHHKDAVSLISNITGIPSDVDTIISQHHEKMDGSGFPRGLSHKNIHPLSSLFIVCHDLVQQLYNYGFSLKKRNEIIISFREKYDQGFFKEAVFALESLFEMNEVLVSQAS